MYIPRLHPNTIEEVKQRADIVDVISEYVVLRKRGKDFVGLCPFHDEKTPSFTVSPTKQMYYCFGCQASGNAIKFLMDLGKRSFAEVTLDLARRYQVPVQTLEPEQRQELQRQISLREQLFEVLASTAQFYQHALRQSADQKALQYLKSDRLLKEETIQQFGLGYAPAGWETLYRYLVDSKHYPVQLVEKAGLIKPRKEGNGYYDVFRDRLMIPIRDIQGRVIAFGGRTLTDEQPKYLNSPETELFSKGKTLFALDQAKSGISQFDQAVVVEGYFDAIALHAAGINNAVASLGTAFTIEQARQALRYTDSKQLVFNFDADSAGTKAFLKALKELEKQIVPDHWAVTESIFASKKPIVNTDKAYQALVKLKILNIPESKDADEFLRTHSPEEYKALLDNAPLLRDWQIQKILEGKQLRRSDHFQEVQKEMVSLLNEIDAPDSRHYYTLHCAKILSQGEVRLVSMIADSLLNQIAPTGKHRQPKPKAISQKQTVSAQQNIASSERSLLEQAESLLLRIYLYCPEYRQSIFDELEARNLEFSLSHHRFLWQQILEISADINSDLISILQDRCLEFSEQTGLVFNLFHVSEKIEKEMLRTPQVVQAAIACMERVMREKRYRYFLELWQETDPETEPEKWQSYYQAFYAEKLQLQELDRQRQFSITDL